MDRIVCIGVLRLPKTQYANSIHAQKEVWSGVWKAIRNDPHLRETHSMEVMIYGNLRKLFNEA